MPFHKLFVVFRVSFCYCSETLHTCIPLCASFCFLFSQQVQFLIMARICSMILLIQHGLFTNSAKEKEGSKRDCHWPWKANVSDTCKHVHVQYVLIVYMYIYMLLLLFNVTEYVHMYIMICLMHNINWAMQLL